MLPDVGQQAQAASERARELHKKDGGGGGLFAQAKKDLAAAKEQAATGTQSKRVTAPKNRPTPSSGRPTGRPQSSGKARRPDGGQRPPKKK